MAFVLVFKILFLLYLAWNFISELISAYLYWDNLPILCPGGHFLFEGRQYIHTGLCKDLSSMSWGIGSSLNHKSYRYQVSYNLVPKKEFKSFKYLCYFNPKNYVDALAKLKKQKQKKTAQISQSKNNLQNLNFDLQFSLCITWYL